MDIKGADGGFRFENYRRDKVVMTNSYLALGYECNHKCICCPLSTYNRLHAPLTFGVLEEQINDIFETGGSEMNVTISGGEPTLHEDFFKVLSLLSSKKAGVTVLSNASSCKSKDFVNKIIDCLGENIRSFDYVTAIHSSNPAIHDRITGIDGSFNQTMKGLDNLVGVGIHVSVKHVMSKLSCKTMRSTFEFLNSHFPVSVGFEICAMDYAGTCAKNLDKLFVSFRDLQPYLEETLDLWDGDFSFRQRQTVVFETPLCATDPYYWKFFRRSTKEIKKYLAPGSKDGKTVKTLSECNTDYPPCRECDVRGLCDGIWSSAYNASHEAEGFLGPVKAL